MIKFNENDNNKGELLIEDMNESKKRKYNLFVGIGLFERNQQNQWRWELTLLSLWPVEDYPTFWNNKKEQTEYIISRNDKKIISIMEEVSTFETIFNILYV